MSGPVRRNPVPSLLSSLLSDHLDPGYAAAAELPAPRRHARVWTVAGALSVGLVLGVAAVLASESAPSAQQVRSGLVSDVQAAQRTNDDLVTQRRGLTGANPKGHGRARVVLDVRWQRRRRQA